jgi:CheY-like chemotaxis protein
MSPIMSATMSPTKERLTVLVADKDKDDRAFIKSAWVKARAANPLRFVDDGEELTEYLDHSGRYSDPASAPSPAVILLDLSTSKKAAREVLRAIKANPDVCQIPVIILTSSQAEEDTWRGYDLGVNSYIRKPVTFVALADVLRAMGKYSIEIVDVAPDGNSSTPD